MDLEIEGPVDDLESMFVEEEDGLLGDAGINLSTNDPTAC